MYRGRIVEHGPTEAVLQSPLHAYTKLLLTAVPRPEAGLDTVALGGPHRGDRRARRARVGSRRPDDARRGAARATSYGERGDPRMSPRLGLALYTLRDDCARDPEGRWPRSQRWDTRASSSTTSSGSSRASSGRSSTTSASRCAADIRGSRRSRTASTSWLPSSASSEPTGSCSPGSHRPRRPARRIEVVARIDAAASPRSAAGLRFGFHNHDGELRRSRTGAPCSTGCSSSTTEPLFLEIDLGWAWYAGVDPADLVARVAPRAPLVHVKDLAGAPSRDSSRSATATSATRTSSPRSASSASNGCWSSRTRPTGPRSTRCAALTPRSPASSGAPA